MNLSKPQIPWSVREEDAKERNIEADNAKIPAELLAFGRRNRLLEMRSEALELGAELLEIWEEE